MDQVLTGQLTLFDVLILTPLAGGSVIFDSGTVRCGATFALIKF